MSRLQRRERGTGFTLIEVLVTAAVVAVLAAIALPQYIQHVQRSHRAHARAALLHTAQWLERAATAQGSYPAGAGIPATALAMESERYTLVVHTPNGAEFTLQAWPRGAQARDPCGAFELNQAGQKTQLATELVPAPLPPATCWSR